MDISFELIPSFSIRISAFPFVRPVVPKPGMVMPTIPFRSIPSLSKARTVTKRAKVESNPPEMPITAFLQPICSSLVQSPSTWMERISLQRSFRASPDGTKGWASSLLRRVFPKSVAQASPAWTTLKVSDLLDRASRKLGLFALMVSSLSTSTSAKIAVDSIPNLSFSARRTPHSYMREDPAQTRSVVDSP